MFPSHEDRQSGPGLAVSTQGSVLKKVPSAAIERRRTDTKAASCSVLPKSRVTSSRASAPGPGTGAGELGPVKATKLAGLAVDQRESARQQRPVAPDANIRERGGEVQA